MSSDNRPRRGWLGDLTGGMLPDDGLYIARSKSVLGGQQGWQPLESKRRFAPLSSEGRRKSWEDDEFALGGDGGVTTKSDQKFCIVIAVKVSRVMVT